MWSFQLRFYSDKLNIPPKLTEESSLKYWVETFSEHFLEFSHNQVFDGSVTNLIFLPCCTIQLWSFRCILFWKNPLATVKSDCEIRVKIIWYAFTGRLALWVFQRWDQSFWFSTPMLLYQCEVSNCKFFWEQTFIQPVVMPKNRFRFRFKTFFKHFLEFSHNQNFDWSIT